MILVLADDFTGAAEIGGIARSRGLETEIRTQPAASSSAEAVVIDSDTRWRSAEEAARLIAAAAEPLRTLPACSHFKKVDSVLRGPVRAELEALLRATSKRRVLLVPANPSLGRTIRDGLYLVEGVPINETGFADDPEHPVRSARVLDMLGQSGALAVRVVRLGETMPSDGILVGETVREEDVHAWAERLDAETLAAGGASLFRAIVELAGRFPLGPPSAPPPRQLGPTLFVCASASAYSRAFCEDASRHALPVAGIAARLLADDAQAWRAWAERAAEGLLERRVAILRIEPPIPAAPDFPRTLRTLFARAVEHVLGRVPLADLYVEGGSTASTLVRHLGWHRMRVQRALAPGVVRLSVIGLDQPSLTVKPGSYSWPPEIRPF